MIALPNERHPPGSAAIWLLWLLMLLSSFVFYEPAPYDILALGMILFLFLGRLRIAPGLGAPLVALTILCLGNLISITIGEDAERSLFYFAVTFYLILTWLMFACWTYADPDRVLPVVWHAYVITAILSAICGILGYLGFDPPGPIEFATPWGRAQGAFKDPNVYGPFLVPVVIYLFARLGNKLDSWTLQRAVTVLFISAGVLLGFSRAAWGNLLISLLVLGLLRLMTSEDYRQTLQKVLQGLLIGGVVAVALGVIVTFTTVGDTFFARLSLQSYDVETGGRFENMIYALELAMKYPLGIGPGHSELDLIRSTHNTFLRVLVENGWLSLFAFIVFLVITLWRLAVISLKPSPHQITIHVVLASLIGTTANSLVIDTLHWRHFFLLFGLGWGLICLHSQRSPLLRPSGSRSGRIRTAGLSSGGSR